MAAPIAYTRLARCHFTSPIGGLSLRTEEPKPMALIYSCVLYSLIAGILNGLFGRTK
jgi:hypothetical protein